MKPRPRLQDMPSVVKRRILKKLDSYCDRMSLRHAFPDTFFHIIGHPYFEVEKFHLIFRPSGNITFTFRGSENHSREYEPRENGCEVTITPKEGWAYYPEIHSVRLSNVKPKKVFVEGLDFMDQAVKDFELLVTSNRNFAMLKFQILLEPSQGPWNRIQPAFPASEFLVKIQSALMKTQLYVKHLSFCYSGNQDHVLRILPHLYAPEALTLHKHPRALEQNDRLDEVVKLKHWKNLFKLNIRGFPSRLISIKHWCNIPVTDVQLDQVNLKNLKDAFHHFRKLPGFEHTRIELNATNEQILRALGGSGFRVVRRNRLYTYFPRTKTNHGIYVNAGDGFVTFERRAPGWKKGDVEEVEAEAEADSEESDNDN